jgi:hypothetical protein
MNSQPGEDALMVSGLGAMVGFDDLLPEGVVLNLNLVWMDRLQALVEHLQHAHQLGADLERKLCKGVKIIEKAALNYLYYCKRELFFSLSIALNMTNQTMASTGPKSAGRHIFDGYIEIISCKDYLF